MVQGMRAEAKGKGEIAVTNLSRAGGTSDTKRNRPESKTRTRQIPEIAPLAAGRDPSPWS